MKYTNALSLSCFVVVVVIIIIIIIIIIDTIPIASWANALTTELYIAPIYYK